MSGKSRIFYRTNFQIAAPRVRLIDETGRQLGIFTKEESLRKAQELEVDLVEVAPFANPPVCRLIDYKKFQYLQSRKERAEKKKIKEVELKEVRMGPFVAPHDLEVRLTRIQEFLEEGNRVKVSIRFTGRQMAHPEFGHELLKRITGTLGDLCRLEREAKFEGRTLSIVIGKSKGEKNKETENAKS